MEDLNFAARIVTTTLLSVLALLVIRDGVGAKPARYTVLLLMCAVGYLLSALFEHTHPLSLPFFDLIASSTPVALFLFAWHYFDHAKPVPGWVWSVVPAYLLIIVFRHTPWFPQDHQTATTLILVLQVAKLLFTIGALWLAWIGVHDDLVKVRRQFRYFFCFGIGVATLAVVLAELLTNWGVPIWFEAFGMTLFAGVAAGAVVHISKLRNDLFEVAQKVSVSVPVQHQDQTIQALLSLMRSERLYADHDLRIGTAAVALGVPEHRLRQSINGELGFRNFNRFVNSFRLQEAAQRLLSEPKTSVLTLSLDVGYRSLSSFNANFKERFGLTPTEYREQMPTDSEKS